MNQHAATGVIVEVLLSDALSIGLNLDPMLVTSYQLARHVDAEISKMKWVDRKDYNTYNVYFQGVVLGTKLTYQEANKIRTENQKEGREPLVETVFDEEKFKIDAEAYNHQMAIISQVFVWGLYYLNDLLDNPRAQQLYSLAYEKGHAYGYEEVVSQFMSMLPLIQDLEV